MKAKDKNTSLLCWSGVVPEHLHGCESTIPTIWRSFPGDFQILDGEFWMSLHNFIQCRSAHKMCIFCVLDGKYFDLVASKSEGVRTPLPETGGHQTDPDLLVTS